MLSSSSTVFEKLPTRPPTPPRDISSAVEDAITFLDDSNEVERALKGSRTPTATVASPTEESPSSSQQHAASSNATKKVGFTPRPTYYQIARAGQLSSPSAQLKKSIRSRNSAIPLRSILKQSNLPPPLTPDDLENGIGFFSPKDPGSFAKMLQSVIQQLAGQSVVARLDAYLALNGALKACEGVPDVPAMVSKMSLLMQFITRDMAWKSTEGALDANIVTQALKLTAAMLYDSRLSAALDDDFRTFLIDRSITVMEHADMPKAVIKTHLFLLAQQRFHTRIMTFGRAERIITSLMNIEEKCSGNGAIATRLVIYQRLLEQAPAVMANRMRDWLEHVIHGMLSSIKDIRVRAIETCTVTGLSLGTQPHASKALRDILDHEVEDGQSYCDYLSVRLICMISEEDVGMYVPQIWSAIILFFRNKRYQLEKWGKFKDWLLIIQKCLNSSDLTIRYQGHLAWDRLVFSVMPDSALGRNMFSMLKVPPKMGLDKRGSDPHSKQVRQFALDSYYNLLHYGLRPSLSHEELDNAWDVYVDPTLSGMIKANGKGRFIACGVIHGLCTASTGAWNANAANEVAAIKPEELPKLDPRWVRTRLAKLLKLLEPILSPAMWMTSSGNTAAVDATWYALMQSLAEAGSQEVKTSNELKEAVALLCNLLRRIWADSEPPATASTKVFVERYTALVSTAVQGIGPGPFAVDILSKSKENGMEAAVTPSHRSSKHRSIPQSPFVFLFGLLYQPPTVIDPREDIAIPASQILRLLASARSSPPAALELLHRSAQTWTSQAAGASPEVASELWACIAERTGELTVAMHHHTDNHESQTLGLGFRHASAVFSQGMSYVSSSTKSLEAAGGLFNDMAALAKDRAGSGGLVIAVIEPIAKILLEAAANASLVARADLVSAVLRKTSWPRSRQELDGARKILWGVGLAPHKSPTFDPFDYLYQLANDMMVHLYTVLDTSDAEGLPAARTTSELIMTFLKTCPLSLLAVALRKMQHGLAVWVEDAARKTSTYGPVRDMILSTWQEVLRLFGTLPQNDSTLLKALEPLLVAGLSCPHKAVVNQTIVFWNASFGCQEALEYPPRLEKILRARSMETDLSLPTFPESGCTDNDAVLPAFFETQIEATLQPQRQRAALNGHGHEAARFSSSAPVTRSTQYSARKQVDNGRSISSPATGASAVPLRPATKARLRHDDSQVQFAPIESSPVHCEDSQMLTERQKEVKTKQRDNAQIFPDLSSSPVTITDASARNIQKRLDFTSDNSHREDGVGFGTPQSLREADGPTCDDIPSSPTPSSTKDVESVRVEVNEDDDTDMGEAGDPPSSPPEQQDGRGEADVHVDQEPNEQLAFTEGASVDASEVDFMNNCTETGLVDDEGEDQLNMTPGGDIQRGSDLPSDTLLPTEQLLQEEDAAARVVEAAIDSEATEATTHLDAGAASLEQSSSGENSGQATTVALDITIVEDSFVDTTVANDDQRGTDSNVGSQQSQRSGRKRKRSSYTNFTSKKRKQSPLKQAINFFASWGRASQPDDKDDDMSDEIVVASSQPSYSPATVQAQQASSIPSKPVEIMPKLVAKPVSPVIDDPTPSQQPRKSGRGRPRKSATSTPETNQLETASAKGVKRRASALSVASSTDEPETSFVKETPAPSKAQKKRRGPGSKPVQAAISSQDGPELGRTTRRTMTAVVLPEKYSHHEPSSPDEAMETSVAREKTPKPVDPKEQSTIGEASTAMPDPPVVTPRSIMARLRDVLADIPNMILGPQEEREMDDIMFDIRREGHEAGRRGRQRNA
ncbi:hypothetical protein LTR08_004334 [Meristemomyces frigidus]|nr:hypothetical protein LTR08_004334 [Meristemomyces frigidus]